MFLNFAPKYVRFSFIKDYSLFVPTVNDSVIIVNNKLYYPSSEGVYICDFNTGLVDYLSTTNYTYFRGNNGAKYYGTVYVNPSEDVVLKTNMSSGFTNLYRLSSFEKIGSLSTFGRVVNNKVFYTIEEGVLKVRNPATLEVIDSTTIPSLSFLVFPFVIYYPNGYILLREDTYININQTLYYPLAPYIFYNYNYVVFIRHYLDNIYINLYKITNKVELIEEKIINISRNKALYNALFPEMYEVGNVFFYDGDITLVNNVNHEVYTQANFLSIQKRNVVFWIENDSIQYELNVKFNVPNFCLCPQTTTLVNALEYTSDGACRKSIIFVDIHNILE